MLNTSSRNLALPGVAPLNEPLYRHLHMQGALSPAALAEFPTLRRQIYQSLHPFLSRGCLSVRAFLNLLQTESLLGTSPTNHHITGWLARGLLRSAGPDILDPQSAAGLLLALHLMGRNRLDSLPTAVPIAEMNWWCWCQETPETEPIPCALPLPTDLSPTALVWTPWRGATWLPDWHAFDRGAVYVPSTLSNTALMSAFQVWKVPDLASAWLDRHSLAETARGRELVREQWVKHATRLVRARLTPR